MANNSGPNIYADQNLQIKSLAQTVEKRAKQLNELQNQHKIFEEEIIKRIKEI